MYPASLNLITYQHKEAVNYWILANYYRFIIKKLTLYWNKSKETLKTEYNM